MDLLALAYLFLLFFLLAMLADQLPFMKIIQKIASAGQSSVSTIQSSTLNDDDKQKQILKNSAALFKNSFLIILLTAVLLGFLYLGLQLGALIKPFSYLSLTQQLLSTLGIILSFAAFIFYFIVKTAYGKFRV